MNYLPLILHHVDKCLIDLNSNITKVSGNLTSADYFQNGQQRMAYPVTPLNTKHQIWSKTN